MLTIPTGTVSTVLQLYIEHLGYDALVCDEGRRYILPTVLNALLCIQVYAAIHAELDTGGRVYIVCPLVTESDASSMEGVKATEQEFERLKSAGVFGSHKCARLHGKMSAEEKSAALKDFAR